MDSKTKQEILDFINWLGTKKLLFLCEFKPAGSVNYEWEPASYEPTIKLTSDLLKEYLKTNDYGK